MSHSTRALAGVLFVSLAVTACGPAKDSGGGSQEGQAAAKAVGPRGPIIEVSYSLMADLLHLVEEVSLWRQGMPRTYQRAFDDYFGMDATDKGLLRKFAFARTEMEERFRKTRPAPTFEAPFGPEGLMPIAATSLAEKFWEAVMAAGQPKAVSRALAGIVPPSDAELVSKVLARLAPRMGELTTERAGFSKEVARLKNMLNADPIRNLLLAMGKFAGAPVDGITFRVHPVWAPENAGFEATAYGDRVLVAVPDGKPLGVTHASLVVHEMGRRLLSRMSAEKKAFGTLRFVEKAGNRGDLFPFTEGILDALSHGIAAPLMASGPSEVPPWPGDERRKKFAEALTPILKDYLSRGRPFDGVFARKAAEIHARVNPPRPADFLDGAMVIGDDRAIKPFKAEVVRWTVWKFPPSKKYDYPRKFADNPGRSVLFLFAHRDLKEMPPRFHGLTNLLEAMKHAAGYMVRKQPVFFAIPRESRGYFFLLASPSAEGMKKIAKVFYNLDHIPDKPVIAE